VPRLLTAAETRQLDQLATRKYGVALATLMENAGRAVAETALPRCRSGRAIVFAGSGNNGGDGFVAARHLRDRGLQVEVWLAALAEGIQGEARANLDKLVPLGVPLLVGEPPAVHAGDVIVDALFGTGLKRPPEGRYADGIRAINAGRSAGARVVAVDVPSGLDADSGRPLGLCVAADLTVTMGVAKPGLCQEPGATLAGQLEIADIGFPAEALAELPSKLELLDEPTVRGLFSPRPRESNKGSFGHLLVCAGSPGKAGAAALCVGGALRSGAGLVTLASRPSVVDRLWTAHPEAMGVPLASTGPLGGADVAPLSAALAGKSAFAAGPGIPRGPDTASALAELLSGFTGPSVVDADALNAFAENLALLRRAHGPLVLTPHPGEMSRLCERPVAELQADRLGAAKRFSAEHGLVLVLKGARTVVAAPDGAVSIVPTGNPGLATGGTGDVLCGLIGGLLAQGLAPYDAARAGAYIHGLAGDLAARRFGERGLLAGDLPAAIAEVWAAWKL
jgi:NAD(P)H-hydrate epimerase